MSYFPCDIPFMSDEELRENGIKNIEDKPLNTKIMLSVEAERCPYWDAENNRPTHTCNSCAEPDNHLNVMIDGVRYCLLDIDIAGEICRENVPDTNVGTIEYIRRKDASDWLKQYGQDVLHGKYKFSLMYIWKNIMDLPTADVEKVCRCKDCEAYIDLRHWCKCHETKMMYNDFCSYGRKEEHEID